MPRRSLSRRTSPTRAALALAWLIPTALAAQDDDRRPLPVEPPPQAAPNPLTQTIAGSSTEARCLAQAEQDIAAGDWHSAVQLLQFVLDQPQDTLVPLEGGVARTMQSAAEARIGRLPPEGLQLYRNEFGGLAARMLQTATGPDALRLSAVVANRYFHTDAGKLATARVASLLFDRGEYDAASIWYAKLVGDPSFGRTVDGRARASYALMRSGRRELAQPLLDSLLQQPARALVPPADAADNLAAWILKQPAEPAPTPQLDDWLILYGSAARIGVAPPTDPLLLRRWSHPLTARYDLVQNLQDLLQDLGDRRQAAIPGAMPIVVGGRVAFRTLRGLAVVEADSGELLWENNPGLSAEKLLAGDLLKDANPFARFRGIAIDYSGSDADQNPLTGLLFRDDAYGQLSSDGRQVFSIENSVLMPPASFGYWWGGNSPSSQDPYQRDYSSNQIQAYDLLTGERLWESGGRKMDEAFDPPLAGVFFFGPPVAEGDELFAVGERDNQLHLFVLAPETGELLWSHAIGEVDAEIERDLVRRLWTCTPAVDGGLIICPTATGWLVAVNRHTHRIEWAHRFAESPRSRGPAGGPNMLSQLPLNDRWCTAAPVVSRGHVYYTPLEHPDAAGQVQPQLICLDARTGARRWSRPKGSSLYLGGVFDGRPLLVGRDDLKLLNPDDGAPLWTTPLPAAAGPPSGHGIAVGDRFLLPLQSGQLWEVNLADGNVARRSALPGGAQVIPLGNLAVWKGMLLSLGPFGLVGFEQRAELQRAVAARLAADPHDVRAAVNLAEIHAVSGDHAAALRALDQSQPAATDDPQWLERRRRLTFASLMAVLKAESNPRDDDLERAGRLARDAAERLDLERFLVGHEIAHERWDSAFDRCQKIAGDFALDQMVDDGQTSLRLDVWLGSRIAAVMDHAPQPVWNRLAERIAALLETSPIAPAETAAGLERLYGSQPAAQGYLWRLIEDAAFRRDFAGAETRLRRLIDDGDRSAAAAALARLGDLLVEFGQPVDAAAVYARLAADFGDVLLPSLRTGAETARERFASGTVARAGLQLPPAPEWTRGGYRISHFRVVNSEFASAQSPFTRQLRSPFFERHAFEFDSQAPVMTLLRRSDNGVYWRLPLRMAESPAYNQTAVVFGQGLQAVVWYAGMIHALSLPDRRVLWSRATSDREARLHARGVYDNNTAALHSTSSFAGRVGLAGSQSLTGMVALVTSRYVACHGRGEFLILDPLTGDVLWRRRGIERDARLIGDADTVCVIPAPSAVSGAFALRAADGRPLDIPDLPAVLNSTVAVTSSGFIRAERRAGGRGAAPPPRFRISAFDPLRQANHWTHEFNARSSAALIDDARLFVLDETTGSCALIDLENGALLRLGDAPAGIVAQASEKYAVADARQVYLVLNDSRNNFSSYIHPPALRTSGTVVAFARDGSGLAWQQTVENQNLLLPGLPQSPLLIFLAYDQVHLPDIQADYAKARLLVLDKENGQVLAEDVRATPNGNYYRIDVDPQQHFVDIHAHNERLRIEPAPANDGES